MVVSFRRRFSIGDGIFPDTMRGKHVFFAGCDRINWLTPVTSISKESPSNFRVLRSLTSTATFHPPEPRRKPGFRGMSTVVVAVRICSDRRVHRSTGTSRLVRRRDAQLLHVCCDSGKLFFRLPRPASSRSTTRTDHARHKRPRSPSSGTGRGPFSYSP